jgi:hypothetical protein
MAWIFIRLYACKWIHCGYIACQKGLIGVQLWECFESGLSLAVPSMRLTHLGSSLKIQQIVRQAIASL